MKVADITEDIGSMIIAGRIVIEIATDIPTGSITEIMTEIAGIAIGKGIATRIKIEIATGIEVVTKIRIKIVTVAMIQTDGVTAINEPGRSFPVTC
jgi:hypothetical protein